MVATGSTATVESSTAAVTAMEPAASVEASSMGSAGVRRSAEATGLDRASGINRENAGLSRPPSRSDRRDESEDTKGDEGARHEDLEDHDCLTSVMRSTRSTNGVFASV